MDFLELQTLVADRFYRCNEMSKKQAEDYAWLAVNELKKAMQLRLVANQEAA